MIVLGACCGSNLSLTIDQESQNPFSTMKNWDSLSRFLWMYFSISIFSLLSVWPSMLSIASLYSLTSPSQLMPSMPIILFFASLYKARGAWPPCFYSEFSYPACFIASAAFSNMATKPSLSSFISGMPSSLVAGASRSKSWQKTYSWFWVNSSSKSEKISKRNSSCYSVVVFFTIWLTNTWKNSKSLPFDLVIRSIMIV